VTKAKRLFEPLRTIPGKTKHERKTRPLQRIQFVQNARSCAIEQPAAGPAADALRYWQRRQQRLA